MIDERQGLVSIGPAARVKAIRYANSRIGRARTEYRVFPARISLF